MTELTRGAYPELLSDIADKAAALLRDEGLPAERAYAIAFRIAEYIRTDWGGAAPYLPKGLAYQLSRRDAEIFDKFNGHNHQELAREYGLTTVRIYQIVGIMRERAFRQRQQQLFDGEEAS